MGEDLDFIKLFGFTLMLNGFLFYYGVIYSDSKEEVKEMNTEFEDVSCNNTELR